MANSSVIIQYRNIPVFNIPGIVARLDDFLENFKPRLDDIWICGFPKCGTHWVNEIVYMIKEADLVRGPTKATFFVEMSSHRNWEDHASPRILNTHLNHDILPTAITHNSRMIFVVRNAKDVTVSAYNHLLNLHGDNIKKYNKKDEHGNDVVAHFCTPWDQFFNDYIFQSGYAQYHQEWMSAINEKTDHGNILLVCYEEMKRSPVEQIGRIAKFLDMERDQTFYEQVAIKTDIATMKTERGSDTFPVPDNPDMILPLGKLYRKGEIGDWRNWFTAEQNEAFNKKYLAAMRSLRMGVEEYMDL